jgi:hypothetical protein
MLVVLCGWWGAIPFRMVGGLNVIYWQGPRGYK